jgi:hypothetical protein
MMNEINFEVASIWQNLNDFLATSAHLRSQLMKERERANFLEQEMLHETSSLRAHSRSSTTEAPLKDSENISQNQQKTSTDSTYLQEIELHLQKSR